MEEEEEKGEENRDGFGEDEEISLVGQHDQPLRSQSNKTVTFQNNVVGIALNYT